MQNGSDATVLQPIRKPGDAYKPTPFKPKAIKKRAKKEMECYDTFGLSPSTELQTKPIWYNTVHHV